MSASYVIAGVGDQVRDVPLQHGQFKSYRVNLKDEGGAEVAGVEWLRKAASPAPAVGEQVFGDVTETEYGPKFKAAQQGGFGGGGPRPEDPKRSAAIQRMHSQEMAINLVRLGIDAQVLKAPADSAALFVLIGEAADWLDRDVQRAREAAS